MASEQAAAEMQAAVEAAAGRTVVVAEEKTAAVVEEQTVVVAEGQTVAVAGEQTAAVAEEQTAAVAGVRAGDQSDHLGHHLGRIPAEQSAPWSARTGESAGAAVGE